MLKVGDKLPAATFIAGTADVSKSSKDATDLFAQPSAPNAFFRNNGDGTFADYSDGSKLAGPAGHAVAVIPTDFDNRRVLRISKGSGRGEQEVRDLLQKFAQMRQMMVQLGASTGLMGKIPGFKQFSQMKKLAGMDINALMSAGGGLPPGLEGMGGGMPSSGYGPVHSPDEFCARRCANAHAASDAEQS